MTSDELALEQVRNALSIIQSFSEPLLADPENRPVELIPVMDISTGQVKHITREEFDALSKQ